MICATCFAENAESASVCAKCGRALPQSLPEPEQAAPAAARPPAPPVPAGASAVFRDPQPLQKWLLGLLLALGGLLVLAVFQDIAEIRLLNALEAGSFTSEEEFTQAVESNDARQRMIGWTYTALFIVTVAVFGTWIYRAAKNARAISAEEFRISPAVAVGSFFIPIINWWVPYMAMSEIWRASRSPVGWQDHRAGEFLGWWWAVWVASNLAGNVTWYFAFKAKTLETLRQLSHISILAELLAAAAIVMAVLLVRRLTAYQAQASRGEALREVFA